MRRWRRIFDRAPLDEIDEELRHHTERRVRDYIARGMDPESARRAALDRLGDLDRVRVECAMLLDSDRRARENEQQLRISWLDVKLGVRMLAKYPGLSVVAVVGMAVAIAIGAGYFGAFGELLDPTLPLPAAEGIVGIRNRDATRPGSHGEKEKAADLVIWRDALKSVRDVGAFRRITRNLMLVDQPSELIVVAAMTASGFRVAGVPARLGRTLEDDDERVGALPVVVIAYDEWQRRFDGDPDIIGRVLRLGATDYAVVGVMPESFRFPVRDRFWIPLAQVAGSGGLATAEISDEAWRAGPPLVVFGRLADGFTREQANAEVTTLGRLARDVMPVTHEHLFPHVLPYASAYFDRAGEETMGLNAIRVAISLLLVIVAVNVSILVYARTATRTAEIAVRSALGASRRRIVTQLFLEGLVLSFVAAAAGLTIAGIALRMFSDYVEESQEAVPFWIHFGLAPATVVWVMVLAILAAGIVGVLPALKATGRRVQPRLQQFAARGSAMQLGRTWTALIIVQVAIAVAAMPAAIGFAQQSVRLGTRDPLPVSGDVLRASLELHDGDAMVGPGDGNVTRALRERFGIRSAELVRLLEADADVEGVALASRFPGEETWSRIEVEEQAQSTRFSSRVGEVTREIFEVFDVPLLAGRGFVDADARENATAVIVTETFARRIAGGSSVLGRRVRMTGNGEEGEEGPWLEIIGVVPDFAADVTVPNSFDGDRPQMFRPRVPGPADGATLIVRVRRGAAAEFAMRLRTLALSVDPAITIDGLDTVAGEWDHEQQAFAYLGLGIVAVMLSVMLLSAAGIYAMMSFTVARQRREIGIRAALGADPRRLLTGIFARSASRLLAGIAAGIVIAFAFDRATNGETMGGSPHILLPAVALLMLAVGLVAALGPARRGLAIQPTEALRDE